MSEPKVVAVNSGPRHEFSKPSRQSITLVEGLGVEGDAHAGATVQHLYYKTRDPNRPNLRQVHLLNAELFDIVAQQGFRVEPGDLGENITTRGVDLLHLPEGTELTMGKAKIRLTGRRNPCSQIDRFRPGLLAHLLDDSSAGPLLCGVMSVVIRGGEVRPGDSIHISVPEGPRSALTVV
jgi:MOSC domain-containing protein YiiM